MYRYALILAVGEAGKVIKIEQLEKVGMGKHAVFGRRGSANVADPHGVREQGAWFP